MLKKAKIKFKNKAVRQIKMKLKRDEKIKNRIEKKCGFRINNRKRNVDSESTIEKQTFPCLLK